MTKKENIVSYTMDEIEERIKALGIRPSARFFTMTDEELEEIVKSDPDEPAFYEKNRKEVTVHLDADLMQIIEKKHLNIDSSVNAALRQFVSDIR